MNILDSDPEGDKFLNVGGGGDMTPQGVHPIVVTEFLLNCSILPRG
jgi:hypothetical protein